MYMVICSIVVCAVALVAAVRGWNRGFTGQVCSVLGFAFGSVCAHVFADAVAADFLLDFTSGSSVSSRFVTGFLSAAAVYVAVYGFCTVMTGVIRKAMQVFDAGIIDSLFGALFGIFNGMLWLSFILNLLLCLSPEGPLLKFCASGDANAPESVLMLAPAVIGSPDAEDLHHAVQLRDARKISENTRMAAGVVIICRADNGSPYYVVS